MEEKRQTEMLSTRFGYPRMPAEAPKHPEPPTAAPDAKAADSRLFDWARGTCWMCGKPFCEHRLVAHECGPLTRMGFPYRRECPVPRVAQNVAPGAVPDQLMSKAKILDLGELRSEGYLQEVNRGFFHPLGLALAIQPDSMGERMFILDWRDDPEGVRFEGVELAPLAAKFAAIREARRPAREKALGYWQQPVEEAKP